MPWPTPQEYNEAIQTPARCLADPELQRGIPELTALGLPRPVTGNFASVYRLRYGARDWAVRCLFRAPDDLATRYAAISDALSGAHLPYTVEFSYLQRGILVGGAWHPILKMGWVEGEMLGPWVQRHLEDGKRLRALAERWRRMTETLERRDIAHGDLQHGNVVVVDEELRLVDYDGVFVPALSGRKSHEVGHPNYQHPARTERHFGPELDRFSSWLIYGSLLALAEAPDLWDGDECLILRGRDLQDPAHSPVFSRLRNHPSAAPRALAVQIERLLALDPNRIPPLAALPAAPARLASPTGPAWLLDYLPPPLAFRVGLRRRTTVAMAALLVVTLFFIGPLVVALGATAILLILPVLLFATDPLVFARARLNYQAQRRQVQLAVVTRHHGRLHRRQLAIEVRHDMALRDALERKRTLSRSRYPRRYKRWRVVRLEARIRSILARHAVLGADLSARSASISDEEQRVCQALNAIHRSLEAYSAIDLPHFLRALCALDSMHR